MAIYHLSMSVVSRGKGLSAVAKSAYNACEKITNEYDGIEHNYANKKGYVCGGVMLPQGAPQEWRDKAVLWNEVETVEKSKKARLARAYDIALPRELEQEEWQELLRGYCNENFVTKGLCVQWDIHDKKDGNPHAHIIVTARELDKNGKWKSKSYKEYLCQNEVGKKEYYRAGEIPEGFERIKNNKGNYKTRKIELDDLNSKETLKEQRKSWADHCNMYLRTKEIKEISHLSLRNQGMDRMPQIHLGSHNMVLYRRGARNARIDRFMNILEENRILREIKHRMNEIFREFMTRSIRESMEDEKQGFFRKLFQKSQRSEEKKFRLTINQKEELSCILQDAAENWKFNYKEGLITETWGQRRKQIIENYTRNAQKAWQEEQEGIKKPLNWEKKENISNRIENTLKIENTDSYVEYEQELDQLIIYSDQQTEKVQDIQENSLNIQPKPRENNDMTTQTDCWVAPLKKKTLDEQEAIMRQRKVRTKVNLNEKGLVHSPEFNPRKKNIQFKDKEK